MSECMTQETAMNMSNERAVEILKPTQKMLLDQNGCPISELYFALGKAIEALSEKKTESLTDEEQRIFLASMAREKKVCKEVDENYTRESYEDTLVYVCKEIERKVKKALWT